MRPVTAREQDQPLCPEGDFRFWASVGATATAAWVLGCLAGLAPLVGHPAGSPSLIERLSAAAAAAVWVALCTGAGSLGFASIALVRGRPPGTVLDIASRAFACVAVASLCRAVPVGPAALKVAFDGAATAVVAALLARPAFRVGPLEAFAATAVGTGILGVLAAAAFVVSWAVRPA
jgi:hypothetical protein